MLIILEGPDGAGKSTIALRLVELMRRLYPGDKVDVLHARPPRLHPLDEYVTPLVTYRPRGGLHIICDRWHYGEAIYPGLLGRTTQYSSAVHRYVEWFLLSRGAVVVHVTASEETLRDRLRDRGDDLVTPDMAGVLRTAYVSLVRINTSLPVVTCTSSTSDEALTNVLLLASTTAQRASRLNAFTTYVGAPRARYLLLGDVRSTLVQPNAPAFMPYPGTSGDFLFRHFRALTDDAHVGIGNACDVDDPHLLWRTLGYPRVVALGHNAAEALSHVPHFTFGSVPHPQFVRRFHARDGASYARVVLRSLYEGSNRLDWRA